MEWLVQPVPVWALLVVIAALLGLWLPTRALVEMLIERVKYLDDIEHRLKAWALDTFVSKSSHDYERTFLRKEIVMLKTPWWKRQLRKWSA